MRRMEPYLLCDLQKIPGCQVVYARFQEILFHFGKTKRQVGRKVWEGCPECPGKDLSTIKEKLPREGDGDPCVGAGLVVSGADGHDG